MPLVSVIVAVRNGAATLQRCLDSVAAQDLGPRETIVIDGASTDGTRELLERNLRAGLVSSYLSEPDSGVYSAWNKGIARARGRWISFLGCDDAFHDPGALRALVQAGEDDAAGARVVYGRINRVTAAGVLIETIGVPWADARDAFLGGFNIPHPGTLHHRSIFEQRGIFDESYRIAGDYHLLLGELAERPAAFVDRVVLDMGFGGLSSRPGTILVALREVARARQARGFARTPWRLRTQLAFAWGGSLVHRMLGERAYRRLADGFRRLRGRPKIWTV
ncbi:MAG TPA: glycosyltransferase family 2 protein [Burkholderiales bacterium]|nr:glycosyltransferase family 2 protein [Burkholderiales bacterium]